MQQAHRISSARGTSGLDGVPVSPADDLRQARELALLFCKSEEAIETIHYAL